ncbi:MAG: hypothetical protein ACKVZ0_23235 [Gemmatimonadales bacterium]
MTAEGSGGLTRNYRSVPEVIDYVNRAAGSVVMDAAKQVQGQRVGWEPGGDVAWSALVAGRMPSTTAKLEWLGTNAKLVEDRRAQEAELGATRIRDLVVDVARGDLTSTEIIDPETGQPGLAEYRDVAILFRTSTGNAALQQARQRGHHLDRPRGQGPRLADRVRG